jgi:endonuclease/exonuclease/phosphatase family metal-dependent hydrolase
MLKRPPLVCLTLVVLAAALCRGPVPPAAAADQPAGGYLFCFWNVENLFDDKLDKYGKSPDREFDAWFARDHKARQQKLDNLTDVLVKMNDGRGPDILAVAEVESVRAAELLQQNLNKRLGKKELEYSHLIMEEVDGGRHIATAILTRLPVDADKTQLLGRKQRILEGHVVVGGQELVVIASHWTSRVSDEEGEGRERYAETIYARFRALFDKDHDVAFLVCGDFNDTPEDDSVNKFLRATNDPDYVRAAKGEVHLLNLLMDSKKRPRDPDNWGTHNFRGKWLVFDQVVVSPGLLNNKGWVCDVDSVRVEREATADKKGRPDDFGRENDKVELKDRGWSDHFPVMVRLKVK